MSRATVKRGLLQLLGSDLNSVPDPSLQFLASPRCFTSMIHIIGGPRPPFLYSPRPQTNPSSIATPSARSYAHLRPSEEAALGASSSDSAALDPTRASEILGYTWLTHWQLIEENRDFKKLVHRELRRRRHQGLQRYQQQPEADNDISSTIAPRSPAEIAVTSSTETQQPGDALPQVGIVHGRLGVTNTGGEDDAMDDLTWLASYPEAQCAAEISGENAPPWPPNHPGVLPSPVQLRVGDDVACVRPLWIAVHQEESSGTARLFESVVPLDADVVGRVTIDLTPFCSVKGLEFGAMADLKRGPWLNFFVGVVGDVAIEEDDILWPNQMLHRDRILYNVRNSEDMARFLADPKAEDLDAHLQNLKRLAEERGYKRGWCWHMLRSRWGEAVLMSMRIDPTNL